MSLFNILWIAFSAIPFIVVAAIAEHKPSSTWLLALIVAFAGLGYVSGLLAAQIVFGIFAWHIIYCISSIEERKFGPYSRIALWYLGVFCTAYTAGYFVRQGL